MILPIQTLSPADLNAVRSILADGLENADGFNKVYIALASFVGVLLGMVIQMIIAFMQTRTQRKIASDQVVMLQRQLKIQRRANLRVAQDNVAAKRQVWIDELRKDAANYLATWQEISWEWEAIIEAAAKENTGKNSQIGKEAEKAHSANTVMDELPGFRERVSALSYKAHELQLRMRLRLNPTEDKHIELVDLLSQVEKSVGLFNREKSTLPTLQIQDRVRDSLENVVVKLQVILKEEWERVKQGEMPKKHDGRGR
ncbi:hypothetical protein ACN9MB_09970 [Dyella kyungheensis]|jgi:hypothetical protein|uniref:hypothetical protein n=1 Tax=Dyella kyungheensis TaxID=1242174 RepID=UPI003CF7A41E